MPIWTVASDLVEARLDHAVVARLDPLAPDPFVFYERLTVVAEDCPAIGRFDLEPVLRTCACERESWPPSGCRRARRAWLETIKTMITIRSSVDR